MIFAGFRHASSALSVNRAMQTRIVAARANLQQWWRGVMERMLAEEPYDDPTAHFSMREWADLPPHHPTSPE